MTVRPSLQPTRQVLSRAIPPRQRQQRLAGTQSWARQQPPYDVFLPSPEPKRTPRVLPTGNREVFAGERVDSADSRPR